MQADRQADRQTERHGEGTAMPRHRERDQTMDTDTHAIRQACSANCVSCVWAFDPTTLSTGRLRGITTILASITCMNAENMAAHFGMLQHSGLTPEHPCAYLPRAYSHVLEHLYVAATCQTNQNRGGAGHATPFCTRSLSNRREHPSSGIFCSSCDFPCTSWRSAPMNSRALCSLAPSSCAASSALTLFGNEYVQ